MSNNDTELPRGTSIKSLFQKTLNRHGHPFQYAVLRRGNELKDNQESRWIFEASEFPVEVQGSNTKIDFILSHCPHGGLYGFLVAECKRTNPSFSEWFFAKAPYVRRGRSSDTLNVECARWADPDVLTSVGTLPSSGDIYHIALEAKTNSQGDTSGGRGAIESAATQVLRGMNGLIECIAKKENIGVIEESFHPAFFVPVIFTTARLWATDADIGKADLESGKVDLASDKVERKPWLWLQYHMSPTLKHSVERDESAAGPSFLKGTLSYLLKHEYSRTIAIVGTDGIDSFLRHSSNWWD
jgi:hypothetical protein